MTHCISAYLVNSAVWLIAGFDKQAAGENPVDNNKLQLVCVSQATDIFSFYHSLT